MDWLSFFQDRYGVSIATAERIARQHKMPADIVVIDYGTDAPPPRSAYVTDVTRGALWIGAIPPPITGPDGDGAVNDIDRWWPARSRRRPSRRT